MTPTAAQAAQPHAPAARRPRGVARRPRRPRGWVAWGLGALLGLVALLAGGGLSYQALATARDVRAYPPPGQLVDVGGYKLHIRCMGQGSPTVVLESGAAGPSPLWGWVQPEIATTTRVCAYDRAGLGWSDPSPHPRDAATITAELHALLQRANVAGPYVLVGHSFGGKYVRLFAARYPVETAGLVLVDASHPDQFTRIPEGRAEYAAPARMARLFPVLARLGLLRLTGYPAIDPALPAPQRAELDAVMRTTQLAVANRDEFLATPATDAQVRAAGTLGALPLAVVTATDHGTAAHLEHYWRSLQDELTGLSSNSVHHIIDGATHTSLVNDRRHAAATSDAIRQVVDVARRRQPPTP
jgi:pimeloyl-ACP methyl ester carboxylesterase